MKLNRFRPILLALAAMGVSLPATSEIIIEAANFSLIEVRPSPLRKRLSAELGTTILRAPPLELTAELFRPKVAGIYPAVVLMHGCEGPLGFQREGAKELAAQGYVALLVDSFKARGVSSTCEGLVDFEGLDVHGGRVFDAYAASAFLSQIPYVDQSRIGIMGWAYNAVLATLIRDGAAQFFEHRFSAGISFYPDCGFTASGDFLAPLMILAASDDDWTPAIACERMLAKSIQMKHPVSLHVYPQAAHGFDNPSYAGGVYLPSVRNLYSDPAIGAHVQYDTAAHKDSQTRVYEFFERNLR